MPELNTPPSSVLGPLDQVVSVLERSIKTAQSDLERAERTVRHRKVEIRRLEAAQRVLLQEKKVSKKREWTPEQRQAASERINKMNEARRVKREAEAATA